MKTVRIIKKDNCQNNKFIPSTLNSVALINYIYFSKIAQRAVHRINYLGTVSASYAFNHNLDIPGTR